LRRNVAKDRGGKREIATKKKYFNILPIIYCMCFVNLIYLQSIKF
jgi:hypothetical protein